MTYIATAASIELFKKELSPDAEIVTPESDKYEASLKRWSAAAERKAALVVFPATSADVSKAVLFSKANQLEVAVRGGGHSTSGASSTEGGLCIDLGKMRGVSVDAEKKTVTAQGGALWADVDTEAAKYELACVGGTVNHTGIGGLTLGGGWGVLTSQHGLVIDNLLSVETVLADGSIVTASSTTNPDLFWAIRGAGVGFGVTTSFTYQAHEQKNPIWGGMLLFPKTELENVLKFANKSITVNPAKHTLMVGFSSPPGMGMTALITVVAYNGEEEDAKAFFKPLLDLNPLANTATLMPYEKINTLFNEMAHAGGRRTFKGSAFKPPLSPEFAKEVFSDYEKFLADVPDAGTSSVLLEFVPYHKINEVEHTATAYANRGAVGNYLFAVGWTNEEFDEQCREWTRVISAKTRKELMRRIEEDKSEDVTKTGVGEYLNYDGLGASAEVLFGVNYPRLRELKKKYDPSNVFSRGPKLLA